MVKSFSFELATAQQKSAGCSRLLIDNDRDGMAKRARQLLTDDGVDGVKRYAVAIAIDIDDKRIIVERVGATVERIAANQQHC